MTKTLLKDYLEGCLLGRYVLRKDDSEANIMKIRSVYPELNLVAVYPGHGLTGRQKIVDTLRFPSQSCLDGKFSLGEFENYMILTDNEAKEIAERVEKVLLEKGVTLIKPKTLHTFLTRLKEETSQRQDLPGYRRGEGNIPGRYDRPPKFIR